MSNIVRRQTYAPSQPIILQLRNGDGTIPDLTGASVKLRLSQPGTNTFKVDASMTISNVATAEVRYTPVSADVDTVGVFQGYVVVTYSDTTKDTFPRKDFVVLEVTAATP